MSKHTKGPWTAEGPDMFGDYNVVPPGDSLAVAAVVSNLRPAEEVAANAALVSAATSLLATLGEIARGRPDCGRPIASEKARQLARDVLVAHGLSWPSKAEGR